MRGIKIPQYEFVLKMRQGGHICGTLWYLSYVEGMYMEGSVCLV